MARRRLLSFLFLLLCVAAFAGFVALGLWQVQRLAWKEDLIARVDARVHAAPVTAPAPGDWASVSKDVHEYRRVQLTGEYRVDGLSLVAAATEEGQGYWVMVPLQRADGSRVYINRGFVPQRLREQAARGDFTPRGQVSVTGLLRLNQPGGGVLRDNVPTENRWYSRDVQAMAELHGLAPVAPYFVDAEASTQPGPIGGLTVIRFPNNHRVYAITWFALALGVMLAAWLVVREQRKG
ncbi:SURF1 family protein [uncultured Alcanivorax sp.]|jgi:surfeit locus 1 family protein|uniref:SURF1 family protein n=1 Tax=Alcanivorax sp. TaxID=1872427 RepID=UPI002607E4F7|nr:SURF1 family protein [uncultured Alcanivorax sp.]